MTDKRFIENPVEAYEKLKQKCEALQMSDNEAREIVAELKAECEALRDEKAYADMACEQFEKQINEYSHTLTEIKGIAEENIRIADLEGLNGVYRRGLAEQILQKN